MILKNVSFKKLTTFKIGGKAKYYAEAESEKKLVEIIGFAKSKNLPLFILGGGSDILVNDGGFNGLVLKFTDSSCKFETDKKSTTVIAGSGMVWDKLVEESIKRGLQGIECLSGIPGSVGAAPIQNIGAYGQEIKNVFLSLKAYDINRGIFRIFNKKDCHFGYRESVFKSKKYWQKYVITSITLKLNNNNKPSIYYESLKNYLRDRNIKDPTLSQIRNAVLEIRSTKFENYKQAPNAGSFFKNPIVSTAKLENLQKKFPEIPYFENGKGKYKCFAAWFIEKAGWKGKKFKNAQVSPKHALVLINPDKNASASEIKTLAKMIVDDVNRKFGVKLEREVQYI